MSHSTMVLTLREPASPRRVERCTVCGFAEVRTDEVAYGPTLLAECPQCEHRWTAPLARPAETPPIRVTPVLDASQEGAAAA